MQTIAETLCATSKQHTCQAQRPSWMGLPPWARGKVPYRTLGAQRPSLPARFLEECSPRARGKGPNRTLGAQRPSLPALFWKSADVSPTNSASKFNPFTQARGAGPCQHLSKHVPASQGVGRPASGKAPSPGPKGRALASTFHKKR